MSELKVYGFSGNYYLKSEADKVIAELEENLSEIQSQKIQEPISRGIVIPELHKKAIEGQSHWVEWCKMEKALQEEVKCRNIYDSDWYKEWESKVKPVPIPKQVRFICILCGDTSSKPEGSNENLCFFCRNERYRKRNKVQTNLFFMGGCCDADKVIAHHKYKRCLAMADYCFARSVAEDVLHTNRDGIEHSDYWLCRHKMWLKLAEKFKEAK